MLVLKIMMYTNTRPCWFTRLDVSLTYVGKMCEVSSPHLYKSLALSQSSRERGYLCGCSMLIQPQSSRNWSVSEANTEPSLYVRSVPQAQSIGAVYDAQKIAHWCCLIGDAQPPVDNEMGCRCDIYDRWCIRVGLT